MMNELITLVPAMLAAILGGYLIGSVPVAWLVCRWVTGNDIRNLGSGNVGVMNTALQVTRWAAIVVFLAEAGKGILAALIPTLLGASELIICITILSAVIGTRWPVWLGFSGGRGNTAGLAGLALLVSWQASLAALLIWLLFRMLFKNSFIATRCTLWLLPVMLAIASHSVAVTLLGFGLSEIYLATQQEGSDDHMILKERWGSLIAFLISPPRGNKPR
jgi:glycerol-3-phosphate acyltransferase PlsY